MGFTELYSPQQKEMLFKTQRDKIYHKKDKPFWKEILKLPENRKFLRKWRNIRHVPEQKGCEISFQTQVKPVLTQNSQEKKQSKPGD